jgi:hypothetical protein
MKNIYSLAAAFHLEGWGKVSLWTEPTVGTRMTTMPQASCTETPTSRGVSLYYRQGCGTGP